MIGSSRPHYRGGMRLALLLLALPAAAAARPADPSSFEPRRFSVETVGSGPDVILIPGLTASRNVWRATVASLPGYRYHLVQVAGFAGAPAGGNARGAVVAPLADEIARYIQANHLRHPAIVGHSMGGTLALMLAARHPALVGKAMVVDMLPQPAGLIGAQADDLRGLADTLRGLGGTEAGRSLIDSAIRLFGDDEAVNSRSDPDVVARATDELALTDLTAEVAHIRAPLTIVYACAGPATCPAADRTWRAAYAGDPAAHLVRIAPSGHMIMADQPARFRTVLRSFLDS
jgi:pimeloyl-ACP methyl ester carboxylesterase